MKQKFKFFVCAAIFITAGFGGGILTGRFYYENDCLNNQFQFINKELVCSDSSVVKKHAYAELKSKLEDFIQSKIKEDEVSEISIYFRDLKNGPTLGINEHALFSPASLLKLPVLLTYLSLAEEEPGLLEKKLKYHTLKDPNIKQHILPSDSIKEDTVYTVNELLTYAIVYSDNNAYLTLVQYINQSYPNRNPILETFKDLGIIDPRSLSEETITVKLYASIFVQLYNATFLREKKTSEKALALLSDTDYKDGIVAGVPSEVRVAHKFGERFFAEDIKQFHDCGIVYYPKNPYLLCVMTRGNYFDKLPGIISAISKMVYEKFDSRRF